MKAYTYNCYLIADINQKQNFSIMFNYLDNGSNPTDRESIFKYTF